MRTLTAILLVACAMNAHAQFPRFDTTCGSNNITELDAGGVRLPNEDAVFELDSTDDPAGGRFYTFAPMPQSANLDLFVAICREPPGPVAACYLLDSDGAGSAEGLWLNNGHYYVVVEAVPNSPLACGEFSLSRNGFD